MLDKTLNHMHQNPVVAGFIDKEEDWKYSSARDFCGRKRFINLHPEKIAARGQIRDLFEAF